MTFDELLTEQTPCIDGLVNGLARRNLLSASERDDFRVAAFRALERNDYELLRSFDGRCTWESHLTTMLTREFFSFQEALWGRWRPTSRAVRAGAAGILLEELVVRDGMALAEAFIVMRKTHQVDMPWHRLSELAVKLRLASEFATADKAEQAATDPQVYAALRSALQVIPPEDRLLLQLRFRDGQRLPAIATLLRTEARPLQRRIDEITEVIRQSMLAHGVAVDDVEPLLELEEGEAAPPPVHRWWGVVLSEVD